MKAEVPYGQRGFESPHLHTAGVKVTTGAHIPGQAGSIPAPATLPRLLLE